MCPISEGEECKTKQSRNKKKKKNEQQHIHQRLGVKELCDTMYDMTRRPCSITRARHKQMKRAHESIEAQHPSLCVYARVACSSRALRPDELHTFWRRARHINWLFGLNLPQKKRWLIFNQRRRPKRNKYNDKSSLVMKTKVPQTNAFSTPGICCCFAFYRLPVWRGFCWNLGWLSLFIERRIA